MKEIPTWAGQMACDLANAEIGYNCWTPDYIHHGNSVLIALARLIAKTMPEPGTTPVDELAAFKREVSEAIYDHFQKDTPATERRLCAFIIPEPVDPLVDAVRAWRTMSEAPERCPREHNFIAIRRTAYKISTTYFRCSKCGAVRNAIKETSDEK